MMKKTGTFFYPSKQNTIIPMGMTYTILLYSASVTNEHDDTSSGEECESSSESEVEHEGATDCSNKTGAVPREVGVLQKSIVMPMAISSDAAMALLLKFLVALIKYLAGSSTGDLANLLACELPESIYMLQKQAHLTKQSDFVEYIVCPACYSLYTME